MSQPMGQPPPYNATQPGAPPPPGFPNQIAPQSEAPYPTVHQPYPQATPYPQAAPYPPAGTYPQPYPPQQLYQQQPVYRPQEPQVMVIHADSRHAGKPLV